VVTAQPDLKPLIVGEMNPYGVDPAYALYHLPRGAAGNRLHTILQLSDVEYLRTFDRVNLCTGKWSAPVARAEARRLVETVDRRPGIVLLGKKVAEAFGLYDVEPFTVFARGKGRGAPARTNVVVLPHPSGRNRIWNDPRVAGQARAAMTRAGLLQSPL
jgi:hypothetical protein